MHTHPRDTSAPRLPPIRHRASRRRRTVCTLPVTIPTQAAITNPRRNGRLLRLLRPPLLRTSRVIAGIMHLIAINQHTLHHQIRTVLRRLRRRLRRSRRMNIFRLPYRAQPRRG